MINFRLVIILMLAIVFGISGCFKEVVEVRPPLPDIIWPPPPEIPRIRFINAISKPEDLNIKESFIARYFRFLKGSISEPLINPYGITADRDGRLFVVDNFRKNINVFDEKSGNFYTFPNKDTSFLSPIDIALDNKGNIYVSDSKKAVIAMFKAHGKEFVKDIGGSSLKRPTGLAVNETTGELLVVDTLDSKIIRYDLNTFEIKGEIGEKGSEQGMLYYPTNITVSKDGLVYVTDALNFRIQIFAPDGKFLRTFGRAGDSPGYFARPRGVAVDSDGNIYVVDALFDNVQIFDIDGKLLMAFGKPGYKYGEFWLPSAIFIDSRNRIYVSDSYNNRVQVFQYMKGDELLNQ